MKNLIIVASGVLFALPVFSAQLEIGEGISAMGLNGKSFEEQSVELVPGTHQLVARYSNKLPHTGKHPKRIQSKVKIFTFEVEDQSAIKLTPPRYIKYSQAQYAINNDSIAWQMVDDSNDVIEYSAETLRGNEGMFPYSDIERAIATYNTQKEINVDFQKGILNNSQSNQTDLVPAKFESDKTDLTAVQEMYMTLDEAQRKEFRKWLIDIE